MTAPFSSIIGEAGAATVFGAITFDMSTGIVESKSDNMNTPTDNGTGDYSLTADGGFPEDYFYTTSVSQQVASRRGASVGIKDNDPTTNKTTSLLRIQASLFGTTGSNPVAFDAKDVTIIIWQVK